MEFWKLHPTFDADTGSSGEPSITDQAGLDSFLDGMSNTAGTESDGDESSEEAEQPADEDTPPEDTTQTQQKPAQDKQGYAFAEMRKQNAALTQQTAQLTQLITKLATANGIQFTDQNDMIAKLSDDALTKIAQKQGIPKEYLQRMELLEQHFQQSQAEQLKATAFIGFQKVKDEFNLTDDELKDFAAELDTKGKNPFTQKVDLIEQYTAWHFKEILAKQTQVAVEAALKKTKAADQHSSTPSSANGKPDSGKGERITTVAGLDDFLRGMK